MKKMMFAILIVLASLSVFSLHAQDGAQVRFTHHVDDVSAIDVFVDGEKVLEAVEWLDRSDFLSFEGTISVVFAPAGEGVDAAITDPMDVDLTASHDYTISVIGKTEVGNVESLVIDETEELAANLPSATQTVLTVINGLSNVDAVDFVFNGEVVVEGLAFGEVATVAVPSGSATFDWYVSGDWEQVIRNSSGFTDPYGNWMSFLGGFYSGYDAGGYGIRTFEEMSVNMVEFLPAVSALEIELIGTFETLITAIEVTGLSETLSGEGSFLLLAPSDDAFALLPDGMLDDLLANPDALADLLLYHVFDGIPDLEQGESNITTMNGDDVTFVLNSNCDCVNNANLGLGSNSTNGLIIYIDAVLIPPNFTVGAPDIPADIAATLAFNDRAWNEGDFNGIEDYISEQFTARWIFEDGSAEMGIEGYMEWVMFNRSLFPDLHTTTLEQFVIGDVVIRRGLFEGTHTGEVDDIVPTGNTVSIEYMNIFRFVDGKLVSIETAYDPVAFDTGTGRAQVNQPVYTMFFYTRYTTSLGYITASNTAAQNGVIPFSDWGSFDIFLTALETTGLDEMLAGDNDYVVFAPTDAAFEALPEAELEAILSDEDALRELLLAHIVEGNEAPFPDEPVIALAGNQISIDLHDERPPSFNGDTVNLLRGRVFVNNGIVILTDGLFSPPESE